MSRMLPWRGLIALAAVILCVPAAVAAPPIAPVATTGGITYLSAGDVNADGITDMVDWEDDSRGVKLGLRTMLTGSLRAVAQRALASPPPLTFADLDGNNRYEVILVDDGNQVRCFEFPPISPDPATVVTIPELWTFPLCLTCSPPAFQYGLLDGVHNYLVFLTNLPAEGIEVRSAGGTLVQQIALPSHVGPAELQLADVDGDGKVEILAVLNDPGMNTQHAVVVYQWVAPLAVEPHLGAVNGMLQVVGPHPARSATTIAYTLPERGLVRLVVHDAQGRVVRTLVDGAVQEGRHEIRWRGESDSGSPLPAGAYFYDLHAKGVREGRKLIWLR